MGKVIINEEFLQQLEALQTLVKNNVAGLFGGNHRSKTFGSSCEFADYRDYIPGDDISKMDWNAYARFEKLYMKLFLDERQLHTRIYIDASRSMGFGKGAKGEQAIKLAATFAYLSLCEMDKVSIYAIRDNAVHEVSVNMLGKDAYIAAVGNLNQVEFDGECCITEALLPEKVGYGDGMSIIISDFLTDSDYERAIDYLADKKRDVFCIQVLDKEELHPQIRGKVHLFDSEDNSKFYRKNVTKEIIKAYKMALEYATGRISNYCASRNAEYMLVSAEETMGEIVFRKLTEMGVLK